MLKPMIDIPVASLRRPQRLCPDDLKRLTRSRRRCEGRAAGQQAGRDGGGGKNTFHSNPASNSRQITSLLALPGPRIAPVASASGRAG